MNPVLVQCDSDLFRIWRELRDIRLTLNAEGEGMADLLVDVSMLAIDDVRGHLKRKQRKVKTDETD